MSDDNNFVRIDRNAFISSMEKVFDGKIEAADACTIPFVSQKSKGRVSLKGLIRKTPQLGFEEGFDYRLETF